MKLIVYYMFLLCTVLVASRQLSSTHLEESSKARPLGKTGTSLQNHQQDDALTLIAVNVPRSNETGPVIVKLPPTELQLNSTYSSLVSNATTRFSLKSPQSETLPTNGGGMPNYGNKMAASKAGECASSFRRTKDKRGITRKVQSRIVGGMNAEHGEFPYQVSIQVVEFINYEHICGGAIVSNRFVVTSANCVNGRSLDAMLVVAGEYSLSSSQAFEQERDVVTIIVHPEYEYLSSPVNDIAILELSEPLSFGFNVASIALALEEALPNTQCMVTGWGTTSEGGQYADTLQKLPVTIMNDQNCMDLYGAGEILADRMVCAVDYTTDGDFCQGDEGGPLQCSGYLQGLASWGTGCDSRCPGVYTKVIHYSEWIRGVIGENEG